MKGKLEKSLLFFRNVPESSKPEDDLLYVQELLSSLEDDIDLKNIKVFRLGKLIYKQSRLRLLKVCFVNPSHAQWLIFNFKSLLVCKSDKTPYQRVQLSQV